MQDVEDVGEQRGVRCLMPRQGLEQLAGARHRERQDQPVSLRQGQRPFSRLVRRALVTELTMGEPGEQVRLHDRDVTDDRGRAIENILQHAQSFGRIAFRETDHRAGITDLTGAGPLVIDRREHRAGFAGPPEAGLGGQHPAGHLARQRVRSLQLRSQVFGRAELLERLMVAAATGVQHAAHDVQKQSDVRPGVCLQGPRGAPQPPLALVELARHTIVLASVISAGAITGSVPQPYRSASAIASRQRAWVVANGWIFDANASCARQPTSR